MPRVTFIIGLAGCGKSHRARELEKRSGARPFEGIFSDQELRGVEEVIHHLRMGGDCSVEELQLCFQAPRDAMVKLLISVVPGVDIQWIFFANDLDAANWNVENRPDKDENVQEHLELNGRLTKLYEIPPGVVPEPIFRIPPRTLQT